MFSARQRTSDGESSRLEGFLTGLVSGMFLGVALGLLLAPHRGEVTRRKIARRAGEAREEVKKAVEDLRERRGDQGEEDDEEV